MGEEKSKLVKALKGFKEMICQKYDIKEMILFGSQVSGEANESSDVDLIVVGNEFKNKPSFNLSFSDVTRPTGASVNV
ncbi:hypothetical protein C5S32_01500, partial [ANME-1 cluster archaeon GoMg1]|nr:hypothetical protein [ANME-1 cluster archaeon GoMg1]